MDISDKFSLSDFLAYLFPGIMGTLGLCSLLLLAPLSSSLQSLLKDLDPGTGIILLLTLSYITGVVFSGFAEIVVRLRTRRKPFLWIKKTLPVPGFEKEIKSAFRATFRDGESDEIEWSAWHFYLCRSMVFELMPNIAPGIRRQISLRQLRMNLIPAITIWAVAGVGWGIKIISDNKLTWGDDLIVGSVILWFLVIWALVNRMDSNEKREVREVLTAFLAGYKKGLFKEKKDSESKTARS